MKIDMSNSEIDQLEKVLTDFEGELEDLETHRSFIWRIQFLICFVSTLFISMINPSFWWLTIAVIAYFAGSLYIMLKQRAKASLQIIEHQKQIRLVRLLREFQAPLSEE